MWWASNTGGNKMTAVTETALKKYWAVVSLAVTITFGGAVWATKVNADVESMRVSIAELRNELRETSRELRWLRESMIAAGTAKSVPAPKED